MLSEPNEPASTNSLIAHLYQRYWLTLFTAIRQHISIREDAEDILLEVFVAAMKEQQLPRLSEPQQLAWLRRVAANKCVDYHRRLARRMTTPLEHSAEQLYDDERLFPEQVALRQEQIALLQERLSSLPATQQEVLRLRFGCELSCAEIAVHMQKSEGAVRTLLSRTLNLLRTIYAQQKEERQR